MLQIIAIGACCAYTLARGAYLAWEPSGYAQFQFAGSLVLLAMVLVGSLETPH